METIQEINPTISNKIQFSYSKIHLFDECKRQYYYRYLRKDVDIKQTVWPGTIIGMAFHQAMEEAIVLHNDGASDTEIIRQTKGTFQQKYEAFVIENKKYYKKSKEVSGNLMEFYGEHDRMMVKVVRFLLAYLFISDDGVVTPEKKFTVGWDGDPDVELTGFIDVLSAYDNIARIHDLKITKDSTPYYFVDWSKSFQKLVYEYYVYKETGRLPESFCYIVFNREQCVLFIKETVNMQPNNFTEYFSILANKIQEIKAYTVSPDLEAASPDPDRCKWCPYAKDYCDKRYVSPVMKSYAAGRLKQKGIVK